MDGTGANAATAWTRRTAAAVASVLALLVFAAFIPVLPAAAGDAPLAIVGWRAAGDRVKTRLVMEFDREAHATWFYLDQPHRLVVDLPDARLATGSDNLARAGLVSAIRFGSMSAGRTRLILTSDKPFIAERVDMVRDGEGGRLTIDLAASSEPEFATALDERASITGSTAAEKGSRLTAQTAREDGRRVVVLDAGHGGIDSGAIGVSGTREKQITLEFARALGETLAASGRFVVHYTRESDMFLPLDERVRIGREHQADLFVSLHADTISLPGIRGATVYTISEKASDELAAALAENENKADAVGGVVVEDAPPEVTDILVDLVRRETHGFSVVFARSLVGELTGRIDLINNPIRSAGFRVLRAPDVPSVLVELGYLSNARDEELLRDPAWRARAVEGIASAVNLYFAALEKGG